MRLTLKFLEEFGKKHGIKIERVNRRYFVWKFDHTVHDEPNLKEAYASMLSLVNEEDPDRIVITSNSFAMHTKAYEEYDAINKTPA